MRIVAALGGNALLLRGEAPDFDAQERHVREAAEALAPLVAGNELVITHGNGPQVGVLALESAADPALSRPYPFDALVAETQGLIGNWLVGAIERAAPASRVACLVTRTAVDRSDGAFTAPTKFVGPVYSKEQAQRLAAQHAGGRFGRMARSGAAWWHRPSRKTSLTWTSSKCCLDTGSLSSVPAVEGFRSLVMIRVIGGTSRPSSTRISPQLSWRQNSGRTSCCSSPTCQTSSWTSAPPELVPFTESPSRSSGTIRFRRARWGQRWRERVDSRSRAAWLRSAACKMRPAC